MKLPKLYNPFKAHIVELANGKFIVRRITYIGWEYKERTTFKNDDVYWWYILDFAKQHCCVDTYEQAVALRDKVHVKYDPMKAVKVHG
jgi:hypothetical protein